MLKKKKTTASGKLVLIKSVRRHWTSGGCPFSADRSGTETAQPQNEILCSKGLGGAALNKQAERKITEGFSSRGPVCINTGIACLFSPKLKRTSERIVKFHSLAQFISNISDNSVSSFTVSWV